MKIKNDAGEEIEVFTEAEVAEKAKVEAEKAVEAFKASNPDKSSEVTDLQAKLDKAEEDLKAASGGNEAQITRLREAREKAEKALAEATYGFRKELDEFKKEVVGDTKGEMLDRLSGGDTKLREKIQLEFDNYRPNDNSKKGIRERLEKAYQLVNGSIPKPGVLDGIANGSFRGDGGGYRPSEKKELNPNEKAIGGVLGVTEADRKAHEEYKAGKK